MGVSSSAWSIGSEKAPVLPDPVSASPIMSLPVVGASKKKKEKNTTGQTF